MQLSCCHPCVRYESKNQNQTKVQNEKEDDQKKERKKENMGEKERSNDKQRQEVKKRKRNKRSSPSNSQTKRHCSDDTLCSISSRVGNSKSRHSRLPSRVPLCCQSRPAHWDRKLPQRVAAVHLFPWIAQPKQQGSRNIKPAVTKTQVPFHTWPPEPMHWAQSDLGHWRAS